jgi:hypothetical protein
MAIDQEIDFKAATKYYDEIPASNFTSIEK